MFLLKECSKNNILAINALAWKVEKTEILGKIGY